MSMIGTLEMLISRERWMDQAICSSTDPEIFFVEKGGSTREAKRVCAGCPVRAECLSFALRTDQRFGVFGGYSERERRELKKDGRRPRPPWECRNGHNTNILGRDKNGRCCQCHRDRVNDSHRKRRERRAQGVA